MQERGGRLGLVETDKEGIKKDYYGRKTEGEGERVRDGGSLRKVVLNSY